jgi:hypothetical protein
VYQDRVKFNVFSERSFNDIRGIGAFSKFKPFFSGKGGFSPEKVIRGRNLNKYIIVKDIGVGVDSGGKSNKLLQNNFLVIFNSVGLVLDNGVFYRKLRRDGLGGCNSKELF